MKLTARDKKLLFYLTLFCIIVLGGHFLILKPLQKKDILEKTLQQLENQKLEMDFQIAQKDFYEEEINRTRDLVEKKKEIMRNQVVKENIDAFLSSILVSNRLMPVSLSFGSITGGNRGEVDSAYILELQTDIQFEGKVEDVLNLLNLLHQLPDVIIQDIKMNTQDENGRHTIGMTFYMRSNLLKKELKHAS